MTVMRLPWSRGDDLACRELVELVTDYLEGELSRRERARVRRHLRGCPHCTGYLEQIRLTIRLTGRLRVEDVEAMPAGTREELLAAFRAARRG
ncbi:MAG: anti-sigma factor family protein [Acidimicrobiia bacterium]